MGFGIPFILAGPNFFWLGVVCLYFGLIGLCVCIGVNEVFRSSPWSIRLLAGIFGLLVVISLSREFIFIPAPLLITNGTRFVRYPDGENIAGIKWQPYFADLRIRLDNRTPYDFTNLDVLIETDLTIAKMGQISTLPNCEMEPSTQLSIDAWIDGEDSEHHPMSIPIVPDTTGPLGAPASVYRLRCETLPRYFNSEFVAAIVAMNPAINGQLPKTLFATPHAPTWVIEDVRYEAANRERTRRVAQCFSGDCLDMPSIITNLQ
jgi:hypothetical protein